jgi:hypothetical protein
MSELGRGTHKEAVDILINAANTMASCKLPKLKQANIGRQSTMHKHSARRIATIASMHQCVPEGRSVLKGQ